MKISKTPTDVIIIKAVTNSDWDDVDFVLLKLNWTIVDWLSRMQMLAKDLGQKNDDFYCIEFWHYTDGYFLFPEDFDSSQVEEDGGFFYVNLEEGEPYSFPTPESRLDTASVVFSDFGTHFKCYGKHTGEQFWTDSIDAEKLVKDMVQIAVNKTS